MNIVEYNKNLESEHGDKSYAFLATRVETSAESPYRIAPATPIRADETAIIVFAGAGYGVQLKGFNGYLKSVDDYVKSVPELKDKPVRVVVAVCNFGKYHDDEGARYMEYYKALNRQDLVQDMMQYYSQEIIQETTNPSYIKDIFNQILSPCLTSPDGKSRLDATTAAQNIRKKIFVTHCHGGYIVYRLEDMMQKKMTSLGYSADEQNLIFNQMLSLNFAPANPQLNARSRMISFESAADSHNKYQSRFKEWLQMSTVEFGLCRLPKNQGDIFMCTAIDKAGIEGNPPKVWIAKNIDDWFYEQSARPKETDLEPETEKAYGEHSFIGFTKADNMSKCAQKMQLFACNILKNGVLNALSQSKNKFTPLPSTKALAVETRRQQYEFAKAYLTGYQLGARMLLSNQKKLSQYIRWHQNNRIKLG